MHATRRRGLGWWLALGAVILVGCVGAAFAALLGSMSNLQRASVAQQIAGRERDVSGTAEKDVLDLETALRGFALTRESRFLRSYYAANSRFAADATALTVLERSDDGLEDPSTVMVRQQESQYDRLYARPLILASTRQQLSLRQLRKVTATGQVRLDRMLELFKHQTQVSSSGARERELEAQDAANSTRGYAVAALVILVLVIAAFALAVHRGIVVPLGRMRAGAERLSRSDRGARMPRSRLRELDDLGSSFDGMADAVTVGRQALQDQNQTLEDRVQQRTRDLEAARVEILTRMARAGEYRDDATHQHTERVAQTAQRLACLLGLTVEQTELLGLAAPLHDVGKIGIPDAVLLKPGRLTSDEFTVMKTHSQLGAELLAGSDSPVLQMAARVALHHHERWDGTGYPDGLSAGQIPIEARIVAVADVLDALTHERPYKAAWSLQDALLEIDDQSGRQFDPLVVDALHRLDHEQLPPREVKRRPPAIVHPHAPLLTP